MLEYVNAISKWCEDKLQKYAKPRKINAFKTLIFKKH